MGCTPAPSSPLKRITMFMTKKWLPSSTVSNAVGPTFWEQITRSWSAQTTKIYNTSANHKRLQADKPDGWNSYRTSTTDLNTFLATQTRSQTSSPDKKTLMRG